MLLQYVENVMARFGLDTREDEGQGLVEYALILVLISIAAIATMRVLGTTVSGVFTTITGSL